MNNFNIEKLRDDLLDVLNNSNLLLGSAYYVVKDILRELEKQYYKAIQAEKESGTEPKQYIENFAFSENQQNENQDQSQD